jgi:hypothetical protein
MVQALSSITMETSSHVYLSDATKVLAQLHGPELVASPHLQELRPTAGHHRNVGGRAWERVQQPHDALRGSRQQPQVLRLQHAGSMQGTPESG